MFDTSALLAVLRRAPVVPVLIIDRPEDAVPLGTALVKGGLPALEVTLRTPAALDAIRAMSAIPGGVVGAGTVLDRAQAEAAVAAGAKFLVSPGATPRSARRGDRARRPAPAGRRHGIGGDGGTRQGLPHRQVLPGRSRRRTEVFAGRSPRRSARWCSARPAASASTTPPTISS